MYMRAISTIVGFRSPSYFFIQGCRRLKYASWNFPPRNISLGSSLTVANDSSSWTSSGDFAFGFQQVDEAGFNKIPERTIVWSANRNNLVQRGSRVQPTTDGK